MLTNSEILKILTDKVEELHKNHSVSNVNFVYGMLVMAVNSDNISHDDYLKLFKRVATIAIKNNYEFHL